MPIYLLRQAKEKVRRKKTVASIGPIDRLPLAWLADQSAPMLAIITRLILHCA
jgi:hypothetical protein